MDSTLPTDPRMLSGVRHNRADAWREFERRYLPFILGYAKSFGLSGDDLDDVAQESLIAVFHKLAGAPTPYDREAWPFRLWLRGVIRNKVRDLFRKRDRALPFSLLEDEGTPEFSKFETSRLDAGFEEQWRQHILASALEEVATTLDPVMYQAFQLNALDGMAAGSVAKVLGVKPEYVYVAKHRVSRQVIDVARRIAMQEGGELT